MRLYCAKHGMLFPHYCPVCKGEVKPLGGKR